MRGVHFSLRWLFGVVSFLAVGCGLLTYASPILSKLAFTVVVTALLAGLFSAVYRIGDQRAFWAGFATFGFVYLWMVCGTWQSPDGSTPVRDRLVTTDLLIRSHDALPSRQASQSTAAATAWMTYQGSVALNPYAGFNPYTGQSTMPAGGGSYMLPPTMTVATPAVGRTDFLTTGHSLFAVVFAFVGGIIIRTSYRRSRLVPSACQPVPRSKNQGQPDKVSRSASAR